MFGPVVQRKITTSKPEPESSPPTPTLAPVKSGGNVPAFSGKYYYTVDPKGRIIIPAPFRDIITKTDRERMLDYYLELMNHNIFFLRGHIGMVSSVHREEDISKLVEASELTVAILKKKHGKDAYYGQE
jgi:bifunctional DNA-binding transcriptional regulator/antitoxin component of YhaV-PrlF toxin-antitoxin module